MLDRSRFQGSYPCYPVLALFDIFPWTTPLFSLSLSLWERTRWRGHRVSFITWFDLVVLFKSIPLMHGIDSTIKNVCGSLSTSFCFCGDTLSYPLEKPALSLHNHVSPVVLKGYRARYVTYSNLTRCYHLLLFMRG